MEPEKTVVRLSNPEAARLVVDANAQRFLRPFLSQESSLKAAADKLGVSLSHMSYWLKRFQETNLVTVVRLEPRAGKPVKVYRTTADVFVAPFELLPSATLTEFFGSFGEEQQRRFSRGLGRVSGTLAARDWGLRVGRRDDGKLRVDTVPDTFRSDAEIDFLAPEFPAAWQSFSTIRLTFEEAKALQRELAGLWERYLDKSDGQVYQLQLGLVQDEGA